MLDTYTNWTPLDVERLVNMTISLDPFDNEDYNVLKEVGFYLDCLDGCNVKRETRDI